MIMSINESPDQSPPPSRQAIRRPAQQPGHQSSARVPSNASASSSTRSQGRNSSYTVLRRDILYRAINEFQLSGAMLSSYTDLLNRLGFDLTPLVSQGQTWYLCRGKRDDRLPCRRMVPEIYLRTSVGKVLKAADKPELKGDDLVEELATALSYAICSQHHRTIHKVARAIESRQVVEQWREDRSSADTSTTTPIKEESRPSPPSNLAEEDAEDDETEDDPFVTSKSKERLKVERHYQEILRGSSRERGSGSDAGSISSASASVYSETQQKARDRLGS
ncbi:hypothetical protein M409DRAFT_48679 [Zasmidium cellare ATCC 36951]|uniref:Uncharacterized protein n=1 Tax=Zasmidium cellare ATCC 36951 TaxID=1080233 RepID=A0A6A6D7Y9_ZASCE|nr:uncharacterized protein M409DRAFT_48679 [Zasmidium cellare ATCC 36951]KAF2173746.1 hypothetical protein M409DRAFT_48679 [Zasmidium cellare ATCC 36951]